MPRVDAVLLDFGGVIWNMRWDVCRDLEQAHGLPQGSIFLTLYGSEMWREVECGRADSERWTIEAHRALEKLAGRELPPLHARWRETQHPIAANIALAERLRPAYRIAILSNADLTLRTRLEDGLGIAHLFDDIVCSAEVGVAKPAPEIYRLAAERLGVPASACVFVDDHEVNVRAAEAVGMRAVLHRVDRGDDLGAQLRQVGIVPPRP